MTVLMADLQPPGAQPEAELVIVEQVGAFARLTLDDGTLITLPRAELLEALADLQAAA